MKLRSFFTLLVCGIMLHVLSADSLVIAKSSRRVRAHKSNVDLINAAAADSAMHTTMQDTDEEAPAVPLDSLSRAQTLTLRIDEWMNKPHINKGQWGVRIERLSTHAVIYDKNGNKPLIPASNAKLFTAAAAFEKLGSDYRYRTAFVATTPLDKNGVLNGDLQIIGSGDPTLSRIFHDDDLSSLLRSWADSLIARGLKRITGQIVVPEFFWAESGPVKGWDWDDLAESYAAFPDLMSINDNCVDLVVDPGDTIGQPARYSFEPTFLQGIDTIENDAITTERNSEYKLAVLPAIVTGQWKVFGSVPLAARTRRTRMTIRNPREVWRRTFETVLKAKGVVVGELPKKKKIAGLDAEAATVKREPKPDTLWVVESLPMKRIMREVLKRSHNLSAEHLFRTVGYFENDEWSTESGVEAVTNLMAKWGLDTTEFLLQDGSGLGRGAYVTPEIFCRLLEIISKKPWFGEFYEEMAQAGEPETTLQKRHLILPDRVIIKAKTGTLAKVSSLSGYMFTPRDSIAFSILSNYYYGNVRRVKEVQNGILTELAWSLADQGPRKPELNQSPSKAFHK